MNQTQATASQRLEEVVWTQPYRVRWTAPDRGRGHPPPLNTPSVVKQKQRGAF